MKAYHFMIALCLLVSSCSLPPAYYGKKLTPTTKVDIYYSAFDVRRHYEVIGYFSIHNYPEDVIKKSLLKYAKSVGADAIVIVGFERVGSGKPKLLRAKALKYLSKYQEHTI